jgi:hypothetical protein
VNRVGVLIGISATGILGAVIWTTLPAQVSKEFANCDRKAAASWITSFSPIQCGGGLSMDHFANHSASCGIMVYFTHGTNATPGQVFLRPNSEQPAGCRAILKSAVCTSNCGAQ